LNNSKDKRKRALLQWATPAMALGQSVKVAWLTWAFRPARPKQGAPPIPHLCEALRLNPVDRWRVVEEGGARELALEVRVPTWGTGGAGAHRGGHAAANQVSGGEPKTASRRRGGGRRLGVRGAAKSSGGGRCGDGGAHRWPEVALDGKAASANEVGGQLSASTVPCDGQWLSGQLGVAQRRTRAVCGGKCFGAWSRGARR
jgi:hypothetical protein